jgi:hypothetical protein
MCYGICYAKNILGYTRVDLQIIPILNWISNFEYQQLS